MPKSRQAKREGETQFPNTKRGGKLGLISTQPVHRGKIKIHAHNDGTGLIPDPVRPQFTSGCRDVGSSQVSSSVARSGRRQVTKLSRRRTNAVTASLSLLLTHSLTLSPSLRPCVRLPLPLSPSLFNTTVTLENLPERFLLPPNFHAFVPSSLHHRSLSEVIISIMVHHHS